MIALLILLGSSLVAHASGLIPDSPFSKCWEIAEQLNEANSPSAQQAFGACRFLFDDWKTFNRKGLQNVVIPLKAVQAVLVMDDLDSPEHSAPGALRELSEIRLIQMLEKQGLFVPDRIANLEPQGLSDLAERSGSKLPLGVTAGRVPLPLSRISGTVFTCASCHAGRLYDAQGLPTRTAWLGIPNTSYNVETLTQEMYERLIQAVDHWGLFMRAYKAVHGENNTAEILGLRLSHHALKKKMDSFRSTLGRFRPFTVGMPGLSNGVAAIEFNLGAYLNPHRFHADDLGFVGAPVLFHREFRSALMSDGFYCIDPFARRREIHSSDLEDPAYLEGRLHQIAHIASIFTIGTVGTAAEDAARLEPEVYQAVHFITQQSGPKFPGPIDVIRAERGRKIYSISCASCHGTYEGELGSLKLVQFPNQRVSAEKIGTDPFRIHRVEDRDLDLLRSLKVGEGIEMGKRDGYMAPMLTSLWISAPYFHNGSVPTLWDLMHPGSSQRLSAWEGTRWTIRK